MARSPSYDLRSEIEELKEENLDLKEEIKKLTKTVQEVKSKSSRHRKNYKKFVTDHQVFMHTIEKKISFVQNFIRSNQHTASGEVTKASSTQTRFFEKKLLQKFMKKNQQRVSNEDEGACAAADSSSIVFPEPDSVPVPEKYQQMDLNPKESYLMKRPEDDTVVFLDTDVLSDDFILALIKEHAKCGSSIIFLHSHHEEITAVLSQDLKTEYQKMAVLKGGASIILTDGLQIRCNSLTRYRNEYQFQCKDRNIYTQNQNAITAIAAFGPDSFAVAHKSKIVFMKTSGVVTKSVDFQPKGVFAPFLPTTNIINISKIQDESLLVCDSNGLYEMDLFTRKFRLIKEMKNIICVAACMENSFFALDSSSSLYLVEGKSKKIAKCSMVKHLRDGDQVRWISEFGEERFVCTTKFGFLKVFSIIQEKEEEANV
ncbi:hypothetical protein RRG08_020699 [Elysia crispata]|uniref:Uncharacterized protein n=1 Tax=Elysia crispata TaxID=231223 RepID=A0AAE0ZMN8_9GAST|nr:hypothetical protein RRG08_020699 [Elysia crispata]